MNGLCFGTQSIDNGSSPSNSAEGHFDSNYRESDPFLTAISDKIDNRKKDATIMDICKT